MKQEMARKFVLIFKWELVLIRLSTGSKIPFLPLDIFCLLLKGPSPPRRQIELLKPSRYFFLDAETEMLVHIKYPSSAFWKSAFAG